MRSGDIHNETLFRGVKITETGHRDANPSVD